jgi:hypothetical protein
MIIVRVILVETTRPVRMRPRMETSLVNGHFLSVLTRIIIVYGLFQQRQRAHAPIKVPFIASGGVLNPRPTSLYQRLSFVDTFFPPVHHGRSVVRLPGDPSLETHTTSLRILEEGLLLKCFFNLQEVAGRLKVFRKDKLPRTCSAMAIVLRVWRGVPKLALIEDYFQLTTSK